jgi:3-oxoisoapionate decarboxylase
MSEKSIFTSRREFLRKSGIIALAMQLPIKAFSGNGSQAMGVVVHSYAARWQSKIKSQRFPGFEDALQLLQHCKRIGAGGIQVGVSGWSPDFSREMRTHCEKLEMYLEGSIGLPKSKDDLNRFEQEISNAKAAGATLLRTVCLGGRRYETFKSAAEFEEFHKQSLQSLQWAIPIVEKLGVKLAVENHKDWKAAELVSLIHQLGSSALGVTLDFGNNIALLEDPNEVIAQLAPLAFSTHIKDMAVQPNQNGFLLSEVPLGQGKIDLVQGIALCRKHNPSITFNLEMITRDPLEVACLKSDYWATFQEMPAYELAQMMEWVQNASHQGKLPAIAGLEEEERLAYEEQNILESFAYSQKLGLI